MSELRHDWVGGKQRRIPACESLDGNDRTEKECAACRLVKVTIHYPYGQRVEREWITASGVKWEGNATPPCIPKDKPTEVKPG